MKEIDVAAYKDKILEMTVKSKWPYVQKDGKIVTFSPKEAA